MNCVLNNSFSCMSFSGKSGNNLKEGGQLNTGVVTPPDNLPDASISSTLSSYESPKKQLKPLGKKSLSAGDISAIAAFSAMGLSALSLMAYIKKH